MMEAIFDHPILTVLFLCVVGIFVLAGYSDYLDRKYGEHK